MAMRNLALSSCACLALVLAACAAPDSQAPTAPPAQTPQDAAAKDAQAAASTQTPQDVAATDAQAAPPALDPAREAPMRDLDKLRKLKVRTGGPLPPQVLPQPPGPGQSCRTDADCGNADASESSTGGAPACGAGGNHPCRCVDGTCIALAPGLDPPVDPAPQPPEQR